MTQYKLLTSTKSAPVTILSDEGWTIYQSEAKDGDNVAKFYKAVGVLNRCVWLRRNAVRRLPWRIMGAGKKPLWESTEKNPPDSLVWAKGIRSMLGLTEAALVLGSEAFLHKERNRARLLDLKWFSPASMEPVWDKDSGLTKFERRIPGVLTPISLPVEDVVYTWYRDPLHETKPDQPPAAAAMAAAGVLYNKDFFTSAYLERGSIKATLLTVKGSIAPQEKERLKAWWRRFFGGVKNAGNAEVLAADVVPVVIGEGLSDLSNTALTGENREEIATTLGIPHSMVFSDAANFATAGQDKKNFYDETIIPESDIISEAYNEQLFWPFGLQFEFLPETLDIYQEDENARAQSYSTYISAGMKPSVAAQILGVELPQGIEYTDLDQSGSEDGESIEVITAKSNILGYHIEQGVVTRNEARAEIGLPPVDEGDDQKLRDLRAKLEVITVATNAGIPIEQAAALVDLSVPGGLQKPEPAQTPMPAAQEQPQAQQEENLREQVEATRAAHLDKWHRMVLKRLEKGQSLTHKFKSDWLLSEDVERISSLLATATTKADIDAAFLPQQEGGAGQDFFTLPDGRITPDALKAMLLRLDPDDNEKEQAVRMAVEQRAERNIRKAFEDMRETLIPTGSAEDDPNEIAARIQREWRISQKLQDELTRALQDGVDLGVSVAINQFENVGFGFDWTMANELVRDWVTRYSLELIRDIDETSRRRTNQALERWVSNGEPLEALIRDLEPIFGRRRAELIASTEVTRAYAEGQRISYQQSGVVEKIEIQVARDERVCPICGSLHGKRYPLETGVPDLGFPPFHPRCRCWITAVI